VVGLYQAWPSSAIRHPAGVVAPREPVQEMLTGARPIVHKGFRILPLARFEVEARVLGAERYWLWREATLAPIDLALGWGPMSDQHVLDRLELSQGNRSYHYRWRGAPPIPVDRIVEHSANMHLIPASPDVWKRLRAVRPGQVVRFSGALVSARADDGWRWDSSLTRKDSGPGSCELVWVEQLSVTAR
jgi:hypothetical protein